MRIEKPWGYEIIWAKTDKYVGKILHINAGHALSLQFHQIKEETIRVLKGNLSFFYDGDQFLLKPGDSFHIPKGKLHRMRAGDHDVEIVEVSTTELDDVIRVSDNYGRLSKEDEV
jgi:mannose-6-phosphate isomerase